MNQQLILKNMAFMMNRATRNILAGMTVLFLLVFLLIIFAVLDLPLNTESLSRVLDAIQQIVVKAFREKPVESTLNVLVFLGLPVALLYMYLASRNERLILTSSGIRYVSAFPEPFDFLSPGWFIRWDQITHARLDRARFGLDPVLSRLTLVTRTRQRRLRPLFWVNPDTWKPVIKRRFGLPVKPGVAEQLENLAKADLVEYVRAHVTGMEMNAWDNAAKQSFNLEDNPWSAGMTVALLVLLGYALVDTFMLKTEVLAGEPPIEIYVVAGLLAACVAAFLSFRARLPMYICILLPAMIGIAFAAASHPALLRINQLTDTSGLANYLYVRQADGRYRPKDIGPPSLTMDYPADYWSQFMPGSTHEFALRRGGLGYWQLSEVPLQEAYYDYYETLRKNRTGQ